MTSLNIKVYSLLFKLEFNLFLKAIFFPSKVSNKNTSAHGAKMKINCRFSILTKYLVLPTTFSKAPANGYQIMVTFLYKKIICNYKVITVLKELLLPQSNTNQMNLFNDL